MPRNWRKLTTAMKVKVKSVSCSAVVQLFATLWTGCQDSSVHEILQARILEWVAIPFSREFPWSRDWIVFCIVGGFFTIWATKEAPTMAERYVLSHSCCVWLFASLWTIARLAIVASKKKKKKKLGGQGTAWELLTVLTAHCSHSNREEPQQEQQFLKGNPGFNRQWQEVTTCLPPSSLLPPSLPLPYNSHLKTAFADPKFLSFFFFLPWVFTALLGFL